MFHGQKCADGSRPRRERGPRCQTWLCTSEVECSRDGGRKNSRRAIWPQHARPLKRSHGNAKFPWGKFAPSGGKRYHVRNHGEHPGGPQKPSSRPWISKAGGSCQYVPFWAQRRLIDRSKKLPAFFYETALGNRPVREWILGLSLEDRKLVGRPQPGFETRAQAYEGGALR